MVSTLGKDILGGLGGITLSACLVPQLVHMWRTQSAEDVNLLWVVCYITGLSFTLSYLLLEQALLGWASMILELVLAGVLLFLKLWLDRQAAHAALRRAADAEATGVSIRVVLDSEEERVAESLASGLAGGRSFARRAALKEAALSPAPGSPAPALPPSSPSAAVAASAANHNHPSAGPPPMLPFGGHRRRPHEGHHMFLDCCPEVGRTEEEWRAFGAWLMTIVVDGVEAAAGTTVRHKHLELMLPAPLPHTSTASAVAPAPSASSTMSAAAVATPAAALHSHSAASLSAAALPLPGSRDAVDAAADAAAAALGYEPGFSLTVVMGGGHVISEYFVGSGQLTVDVLAVGPRAVQQVQRLGAWVQQRLAQRCGPRMPAASKYSDRLLKDD